MMIPKKYVCYENFFEQDFYNLVRLRDKVRSCTCLDTFSTLKHESWGQTESLFHTGCSLMVCQWIGPDYRPDPITKSGYKSVTSELEGLG